MNIILTCVGRRNYLATYFKQAAGEGGLVVGVDLDLTAPALADCCVARKVPPIDSPDYIDKLLEICQQFKIEMLVSLNDLELPIIARNKDKFSAIGVTAIVSNEETISMCFDKYASFEWFRANGFNTPYTVLSIEEAKEALESNQLTFPLIVKPRWGSASTCVLTVVSVEEMEMAYGLNQHQLKRNLLKGVSDSAKRNVVIQQKLAGTEYGIDVLNDLAGHNRQVLVKLKIAMRAGETDKASLIKLPLLEELGREIGSKVAHIGNLDCDAFVVNGKAYVLELNPRFGGGYPYSHLAGANFPAAIVAWAKGQEFEPTSNQLEYDVIYAKSERVRKMVLDQIETPDSDQLTDTTRLT